MTKKRIVKCVTCCLLTLVLLLMGSLSVIASQRVYKSVSAGPFGTLSGDLTNGYVDGDIYQMQFATVVTTPVSNGYIEAHVDVTQGGTGTYIGSEKADRVWGEKVTYWYWEFFNLEDMILYGDTTYVVYGAHEAVSDTGYVVYTSNSYNFNQE